MILSCGANIIINNKTIFLAHFPQNALKQSVSYMRTHNIGFTLDGQYQSFLDKEGFALFHEFALKKANNDSELARGILNENKMFHFSKMKYEDYEPLLKISLFSKNIKSCQTLIETLPDSLSGFLTSSSNSLTHSEISIKGVNKATGIQITLDYFHANCADSVAIGDSLNDLEMMEYAGHSICMGMELPI